MFACTLCFVLSDCCFRTCLLLSTNLCLAHMSTNVLQCSGIQRRPDSSFSEMHLNLKTWENSLIGHSLDTVKPSVPARYIIHITKGKLLILMLINSDNSTAVECYTNLVSGEEYTVHILYKWDMFKNTVVKETLPERTSCKFACKIRRPSLTL